MKSLLHILELNLDLSLEINGEKFVRVFHLLPYENKTDVVIDIGELQFTAEELEKAEFDPVENEWIVIKEDGSRYEVELFSLKPFTYE